MTPAELIRLRRLALGLKQADLGIAIGYGPAVAKQMICSFEKNRRPIPQNKLRALARALGVPVENLIP